MRTLAFNSYISDIYSQNYCIFLCLLTLLTPRRLRIFRLVLLDRLFFLIPAHHMNLPPINDLLLIVIFLFATRLLRNWCLVPRKF